MKKEVSVAVAPIYSKPSFSSEMVTQALFWDIVSILDQKEKWKKIKLSDNYKGWVYSFYIDDILDFSNNYIFLNQRYTPLLSNNNLDSRTLTYLSFGTRVPIVDQDPHFYKIKLKDGSAGFIPFQNTPKYDNIRNEINRLASILLGVPYLWGGKSSFGFDCSGFIQMLLKTVNVIFPRDTKDQIRMNKLVRIDIGDAQNGDLIFFKKNNMVNHVALLTKDNQILHSSGEVKMESINQLDKNNSFSNLNKICMSMSNYYNE